MATADSYYTGVRTDTLQLLDVDAYDRVLEIGGGEFETGRSLVGAQGEIWGVDIRKPDLPLDHFVLGSITDESTAALLPDETFDLIIANDVIEHVENTEAFVEVIGAKLRRGGQLLLSVPNARQLRFAYHILVRGTFPREGAGLFDKTHLRWFCRRDVVELFEDGPFTLRRSRSVGRMVPKALSRTVIGELLALQNLFLFTRN